jgi:lipopolysaccharide transport system ATP-binding protein
MSDLALRLHGVSKMYKIFPTRTANLADAIGLPGRRRYREFWALRGVDLELPQGERLGIVGRNGAGKSTLLKLITGNIVPSEGSVHVSGSVQALLEAGAGFHPEFTGAENIRAALTLQGMPSREMDDAVAEIADFTELGPFLAQPFRTYSAGMQARLAFATATAIQPEILIVDEMLSAGDAYFSNKANERMRKLVDSGASLLLVSHSLDHVTMFCEHAIWIDRGRIIKRGDSLDVVKAYQQFSRVLEERRLKAKNAKTRRGDTPSFALDNYAETVLARLTVTGDGGWAEIERVELRRDDNVEETVLVGDAQDADEAHAAYVVATTSDTGWSGPLESDRGFARRLAAAQGLAGVGETAFNLYTFYPAARYSVDVSARGEGTLSLEFIREGRSLEVSQTELTPDWALLTLEIAPRVQAVGAAVTEADYTLPAKPSGRRAAVQPRPASEAAEPRPLPSESQAMHWPGEGSLAIDKVALLGPSGEAAVFEVDSPLSLVMSFIAQRSGTFEITPVAVLYRRDGILVSTHVGEPFQSLLEDGDESAVRLDFKRLNLGNGNFVFSVALYRRLEYFGESEAYDLVDRSYEFEVVGNEPGDASLFHHPSEWHLP